MVTSWKHVEVRAVPRDGMAECDISAAEETGSASMETLDEWENGFNGLCSACSEGLLLQCREQFGR